MIVLKESRVLPHVQPLPFAYGCELYLSLVSKVKG